MRSWTLSAPLSVRNSQQFKRHCQLQRYLPKVRKNSLSIQRCSTSGSIVHTNSTSPEQDHLGCWCCLPHLSGWCSGPNSHSLVVPLPLCAASVPFSCWVVLLSSRDRKERKSSRVKAAPPKGGGKQHQQNEGAAQAAAREKGIFISSLCISGHLHDGLFFSFLCEPAKKHGKSSTEKKKLIQKR